MTMRSQKQKRESQTGDTKRISALTMRRSAYSSGFLSHSTFTITHSPFDFAMCM
jgi:hypothetical protein